MPVAFANRFKLERRADHFFLSFRISQKEEADDLGEEVAHIVMPLTLAIDVSLKLFEGMFYAVPQLQAHFSRFQTAVNNLNALSHKAQTDQAQASAKK